MTGSALFFVIVGAFTASVKLVRLVEWLDAPNPAPRRRHAA